MLDTRISDWIVTSGDLAAAAAVASAVILLIAAWAALRQLREARRLREAQFRPFVIVDLQVTKPPIVYLTITNHGPVQAKNVRITFTPPISSSLDGEGMPFGQLQIIHDGIEYLAPGKQHLLLWDSVFGRWEGDEASTPKEGFPDRYGVRVQYEADVEGDRRTFNERGVIDLGLYKHTAIGPTDGLPEVVKQLAALAAQAKTWTSSSPAGLRVITGDEHERRQQALREERERRLAARQARQAAPGDPGQTDEPDSVPDGHGQAPPESPKPA
jgi:hypothetical protein